MNHRLNSEYEDLCQESEGVAGQHAGAYVAANESDTVQHVIREHQN
jgi:hypothetical protein